MAKINLDQYPELKEKADYLLKIEGLAEKIDKKIKLLKGMRGRDELKEIERQISIEKNEIELLSIHKQIEEKKKDYKRLTGLLEDALKDMELNYNSYIEKAMESEDGKKIVESVDVINDEKKLDLFLKLRQFLNVIPNKK